MKLITFNLDRCQVCIGELTVRTVAARTRGSFTSCVIAACSASLSACSTLAFRAALMTDWLSSTWEASWRPFQYFNFYRLLLAVLILLASLLPDSQVSLFHQAATAGIYQVVLVYLGVVLAGLMLSVHWSHRFNAQLSAQVFADVVFVNILMYWLGGVGSGMGALLLVSLAAASLVGRGRLVLFYAALAIDEGEWQPDFQQTVEQVLGPCNVFQSWET